MPNSASAEKRVRQNAARKARNRWRKTRVRTAIKEFLATAQKGEIEQAQGQLKALYKLLDQIAATGTLHKNTASRYKSRLTTRFNALKASKETKAA